MTIFPLTLVSSMVCLLEMSFAQHQIRLRTFLSGSREFSKKDPDLGQTFRPVWDGQCQQWVVWPFCTLIHVMTRPQAAMGHAVKKGDENWIVGEPHWWEMLQTFLLSNNREKIDGKRLQQFEVHGWHPRMSVKSDLFDKFLATWFAPLQS